MAHAIARFEHLTHGRQRPAWAYPLFAGCVGFTGLLLFAMWARSIWSTEQLDRPKMAIDLRIAPAPPPPPPPLAGGEKPREVPVIVPKHTVHEMTQPVHEEKPPERPQVAQAEGDPDGALDGEKGGKLGGVSNGVPDPAAEAPKPLEIPKIPPPPRLVPPSLMEAGRTSGDPQIVPDDVTKTEIQRSGKDRLLGTFKVCINEAGTVTSVETKRSTGFAAYDNKITSTIRGTWHYRPLLIDGTAAAVCTAVTFAYSQR